jgi:hypothetical protein
MKTDAPIFIGLIFTVIAIVLSIAFLEMKRTGVFN